MASMWEMSHFRVDALNVVCFYGDDVTAPLGRSRVITHTPPLLKALS